MRGLAATPWLIELIRSRQVSRIVADASTGTFVDQQTNKTGISESRLLVDLFELLALQLVERGAVDRSELIVGVEDLIGSYRDAGDVSVLRGRLATLLNSLQAVPEGRAAFAE